MDYGIYSLEDPVQIGVAAKVGARNLDGIPPAQRVNCGGGSHERPNAMARTRKRRDDVSTEKSARTCDENLQVSSASGSSSKTSRLTASICSGVTGGSAPHASAS